MRVAHKLPAWGVQADFAAVASHPAALGFTRTWSFPFLARAVIVIDTVVVLTQHREVRRFGVSAVFVGVDVVDLASIGRYGAVWPWAHEILRHGESAKFVGREACLIKVDRAGGRVEKTDIKLVTKGTGHRSVDEFSASHGRAIG